MSKPTNTNLLNQKLQESQVLINKAKNFENMQQENETLEGTIEKAKNLLGLDADSSVLMDSDDKIIKLNMTTRAFIDLNSLSIKLNEHDLADSTEISIIDGIRDRLAKHISKVYGIKESDLYQGDE